MTTKEAVAYFNDMNECTYGDVEPIQMAIKALKQEPCEDAISRKEVLDKIKEVCFSREEEWIDFRISQGSNGQRDLIIKFIEDLPNCGAKTGHWKQYGNSWEDKFKCSECGKEQPKILCGEQIIGYWSDYCPNCGCRMKGEGEE